MSAKCCEEVTLPPSARQYLGGRVAQKEAKPVVRVAKLLLAKLGDFVLPSVWSECQGVSEDDVDGATIGVEDDREECGDMVSLYVHKRDDQPAHEVVQKILRLGVV